MGLQDFIITPIFLIFTYIIAFWIKSKVTDKQNSKYFIPGLTAKILGALSLGFIYQFYYGGGDTFTYFHLGSKYVWEAFKNDPLIALNLIFSEMKYSPSNFEYASKIYTYGDSASYFVVRFTGLLDIITLHTYSATAVLFAGISYSGIWMLFLSFYKQYPNFAKHIAIGTLFVPSVFFWGSGIMKDTLTICAIGWLFYSFVHLFIFKKVNILNIVLFITSFLVLYVVKIYIIICFLPALAFYLYLNYQKNIKNYILKVLLAPILFGIAIGSAYLTTIMVSSGHYRYSIDSILYTAEQTAKWNYYVSEREKGSGYTLGDYDFSPAGLAKKFVPAVITSFFRPFLWEAKNPVMVLSALENSIILYLFLSCLFRGKFVYFFEHPAFIFCLIFSILFGFAIGVTTYNFGSLVRYKIPMIPFLIIPLLLLRGQTVPIPKS